MPGGTERQETRLAAPHGRDEGFGTGAWPVIVSAVLLSGAVAAVVSVAMPRLASPEPAPRIAGVRLAEIAAEYTTRAASEGMAVEDVRAWGAALEAALDLVAERHGLVLLPARAVAAGASDVTREVEAILAGILEHDEAMRIEGDAP